MHLRGVPEVRGSIRSHQLRFTHQEEKVLTVKMAVQPYIFKVCDKIQSKRRERPSHLFLLDNEDSWV